MSSLRWQDRRIGSSVVVLLSFLLAWSVFYSILLARRSIHKGRYIFQIDWITGGQDVLSQTQFFSPCGEILMVDSARVDRGTTALPSKVTAETVSGSNSLAEVKMNNVRHALNMFRRYSSQLCQVIDCQHLGPEISSPCLGGSVVRQPFDDGARALFISNIRV
jgi:hypothetical protein